MASRNIYLTYKKDTSRLLYWVINTSNGIIESGVDAGDDKNVLHNTTGRITVAEIVGMSKLIARNLKPIPSTIFALFQAVIKARSAVYAAFQRIVGEKPDLEIERNNATHKHFIDALTEAFYALGGSSWTASDPSVSDAEVDEDACLHNPFAALSLGKDKDEAVEESSENDIAPKQPQQRAQKKKTGKGKKGKRGRKSKSKSEPTPVRESVLADVPIESYRIIEDKDGLVSEYLMAVYAVVTEWIDLRLMTQDSWREVVYDGLNGAVAATLNHSAVAMVKQTCMAVFAEFPDHESYDTIIQTITRGNPDTAGANFSLSLYRVSDCGHPHEKVQDRRLDVKEQFWIHAYNDLMTFIKDFQMNRTGRPTKAMQAQLNTWSPNLDLRRVTDDERIAWRRLYTIDWLYDLVNLFSSIVVQRNTTKGEKHVYENVDWSPTGPWNEHRRLFGLNEFAGAITSFAMQRPNTDVRKRILPHHVFQLQCIVDSFSASRGWTVSPLRGHVLAAPPRNFRPRRDVDLFMDREIKRKDPGVLQSIDILTQLLEKDAAACKYSKKHTMQIQVLDEIKSDFVNWLGESKYMHGSNTIPPSRFSKTNSNGLWEYSPLLCAAGLVEGLILVQRMIMHIWDRNPELTLILHLHNMLVKKGYLKSQVGLYGTLENLLQDMVFPRGIPTEKFSDALVALVDQRRSDGLTQRQRQALSRDMTKDIHGLLDVKLNHFFNAKSTLMMYHDAGWVPEKIPDNEVKIPSMLYMVRLMGTERVIDPDTGSERLKANDLVNRAKARGQTDASLLDAASISIPGILDDDGISALMRDIPDLKGYESGPRKVPYQVSREKRKTATDFKGRSLLDLVRLDVFSDVCGSQPLSSLNYVLATCCVMLLFLDIENRFKEARHPLWVQAYERPTAQMGRHNRQGLILAAMMAEDDEAMKLFAEAFEKLRVGFMACNHWEDLRETESGLKNRAREDDIPSDQCSVM